MSCTIEEEGIEQTRVLTWEITGQRRTGGIMRISMERGVFTLSVEPDVGTAVEHIEGLSTHDLSLLSSLCRKALAEHDRIEHAELGGVR